MGSNPTQPNQKTTLYNFGTTVLSVVGHAVSAPGADCMLGYFPLPAATLPQTLSFPVSFLMVDCKSSFQYPELSLYSSYVCALSQAWSSHI